MTDKNITNCLLIPDTADKKVVEAIKKRLNCKKVEYTTIHGTSETGQIKFQYKSISYNLPQDISLI